MEMERCKAFRFRTPTSLLIAGPSGCGKTVFTAQFILDNPELFDKAPKPFIIVMGPGRKDSRSFKKKASNSTKGSQKVSLYPNGFPKEVLVLDDLMDEGGNDKRVLDLFTKDSHHQGITVLYLCQDLFPNGKFAKTISRNYIVAFKSPRDQLGIRNLLMQAFPTRWQDVLNMFRKVTERPFGYMLLDLHPASRDDQRILSHLLKDEGIMRCHQLT